MSDTGTRFDQTAWLPERDETFFRLVSTAFPASFVAGASVLLASYDDDAYVAPAAVRVDRPSTSVVEPRCSTQPSGSPVPPGA